MITTTSFSKSVPFEMLGISIRYPPNSFLQKWKLDNILCCVEESEREEGEILFVATDQQRIIVPSQEFIVWWLDGISCAIPGYRGRSKFTLNAKYNPKWRHGIYSGGFLDDQIAPTLHGFGIPKGHRCEIKVFYAQI